MRLLPPIAALVCLALPVFAGESISWSKDFEEAKARAAAEKKVVFVAVNMDGEAANDRLAEKVYADKRVTSAAALTINVIASRFDHAPEKRPCTRFAGIECIDHKRCDGAVRANVLKADANGYVVAPQHVFLGPDGAVILSVPYEISAEELQWCFSNAIKAVDPATAKAVPANGRPPRRLVQGGVFDPAGVPGANLAPPTREQVLVLIKELKASLWGEGRVEKIQRVLMSPEPEAIEYIGSELKNELIGRRGWFRGVPGAPAGAGGDGPDPRDILMHAIGVLSPPVYWKLVSEYLDNDDDQLRNEAIVALEQLAVPDSVRAITSALAKEKNLACRKDLMRALGSAGAADDKARKALLKFVASEKDPTVRLNAVVALGWLAPGADVNKVLGELLASAQPEDRRAAVVAMGLSRNDAWVAVVEKALAADADPNFKTAAEAALKVLKGENLATLRAPLRSICDDGLEREKFFGNGQMQIPGMGGAGGAPGGGGGGAGGGTGGGSGGGTGG
jgi:hypothetical protein